jgi:prevent-host-death family protein
MRTELATTLKRNTTRILADVEARKDPVLITQHGRPAAYLLDVATYDELRRKLEVLEGLALGEDAIRAGKVLTREQARRKMSRWLK